LIEALIIVFKTYPSTATILTTFKAKGLKTDVLDFLLMKIAPLGFMQFKKKTNGDGNNLYWHPRSAWLQKLRSFFSSFLSINSFQNLPEKHTRLKLTGDVIRTTVQIIDKVISKKMKLLKQKVWLHTGLTIINDILTSDSDKAFGYSQENVLHAWSMI